LLSANLFAPADVEALSAPKAINAQSALQLVVPGTTVDNVITNIRQVRVVLAIADGRRIDESAAGQLCGMPAQDDRRADDDPSSRPRRSSSRHPEDR